MAVTAKTMATTSLATGSSAVQASNGPSTSIQPRMARPKSDRPICSQRVSGRHWPCASTYALSAIVSDHMSVSHGTKVMKFSDRSGVTVTCPSVTEMAEIHSG